MNGPSTADSPSDWSALRTGDEVEVLNPDGEAYVASVDMKTEPSDIMWVRRYGLGTRHLLDSHDGAIVTPIHRTDSQF